MTAMTILHISSEYVSGKNVLHIEANAATEMTFDLVLTPLDDYEDAIADLCRMVPHLMSLDVDTMEAADDGGRTKTNAADRQAVRAFVMKWRTRIRNSNIVIGGFPSS